MTLFASARAALLMASLLAATALAASEPAMAGAERAFLAANDKAMEAMMAGMAVKPTGDVDRDFMLMMIPHHQGAIDMCRPLLKYGKEPRLQTLCRDIIANQSREIALMRSMLGTKAPAPHAPAMGGMPMHKHDM